MDNLKKIKRTASLVSVLSKYGFETLVTKTGIKKIIPANFISKNEKRKEVFSLTVYERIRMVLEELGPAYIKLGQLMSNRDDLFPEELTFELQKLQDNVPSKEINIYDTLLKELSIEPEDIFESIDTEPIAAASLSQVYKGRLKEGNKDIVIKVKREGIREIIEADILIMKDFARILERYYDFARKIGIYKIVNTFEKSIISELSFDLELQNMERFRVNFKGNETIYIPVTYKQLSCSNILCMEYIDGIKISEREKLNDIGLDKKIIAKSVVDLYLKQIIDFGFFHADPHSGNIFVLADGKIAFIDYGSVGKLTEKDQEYVGDFIIYGLKKDTKRLIRVIKKMAVSYHIENENRLQRDLYEFLELIDYTPVNELDLEDLVKRLTKVLNENETVLPDYIYLLVRGIILLEGIGRELDLDVNIIEYIKPYGAKLLKKRMSPKNLVLRALNRLYELGGKMEELPEDIHSLVQKLNENNLELTHNIKGLDKIRNTIHIMALATIVSATTITSSILILAEMPPKIFGTSLFGLLGIISSSLLTIIVIIVIIRNWK